MPWVPNCLFQRQGGREGYKDEEKPLSLLGPICLEETRTDLTVTNVCSMTPCRDTGFLATWVEGFASPCSAYCSSCPQVQWGSLGGGEDDAQTETQSSGEAAGRHPRRRELLAGDGVHGEGQPDARAEGRGRCPMLAALGGSFVAFCLGILSHDLESLLSFSFCFLFVCWGFVIVVLRQGLSVI